MATTHEEAVHPGPTREQLKVLVLAAIQALPEDALAEVLSFAEAQRAKLSLADAEPSDDDSTGFGGLWKGVTITDEDIAAVRREMWEGFGERDL